MFNGTLKTFNFGLEKKRLFLLNTIFGFETLLTSIFHRGQVDTLFDNIANSIHTTVTEESVYKPSTSRHQLLCHLEGIQFVIIKTGISIKDLPLQYLV